MFHAQTMQQGDQARAALIGDAAFGFDPATNLAGCPWQRLGDPGPQFVLLRIAQAAGAAFVAKARQAFDALFLIQPMPGADRIVVQIEHLGDRLTAHPIVQQKQGVGPPRQSMSHRPISGQFNQVATRFRVKEATANHAMTRVAAELIRKGRIRILKETSCPFLPGATGSREGK